MFDDDIQDKKEVIAVKNTPTLDIKITVPEKSPLSLIKPWTNYLKS